MTDNEIIKGLECCLKDELNICNECPFDEECGKDPDAILIHSLDLINRQKSEIEDYERIVGLMNKRKFYRKFVDEVFRKQEGKELTDPDFDYIYQLYFEQKAEIERLRKAITVQDIMIEQQDYKIKTAKSEAIKEFAKFIINKSTSGVVSISDIPEYVLDFNGITRDEHNSLCETETYKKGG